MIRINFILIILLPILATSGTVVSNVWNQLVSFEGDLQAKDYITFGIS